MDICIACSQPVRPRQEGLQCDGCQRWQHRKCGTGVSRATYRAAVQQRQGIDWSCSFCLLPPASSSLPPASPIQPPPASPSLPPSASPSLPPPVSPSLPPPASPSLPPPVSPPVSPSLPPPVSPSLPPPASPSLPPPASPSLPERPSGSVEELEASIVTDDSFLEPVSATPEKTGYHVMKAGSQRGGDILVDTSGFSYTLGKKAANKTYWRCSVRRKDQKCPATVIQSGEDFAPGRLCHNHPGKAGLLMHEKIKLKVKSVANNDVWQSGPSIVENVMSDLCNLAAPSSSRPVPSNLVRMANRVRESKRPKHPKDLDFEFANNFIKDGFFRGDVWVGERRHLIFATDKQLESLSKAKMWFMDGTFKLVRHPFTQLFTIHAFIRSEDAMKQVPLAFCIMSGKRSRDYTKVISKILSLLPSEPVVKSFMADFEAGMWKGIRKSFQNPYIHGCAFHWSKAVWGKVQQLGLQVAYQTRDDVNKFVRRLMALPLLPADQIPPAFATLEEKVASQPALQPLVLYIKETWMESSVWPISSWCVFERTIRTNNDVEGWHTRLNVDRAQGKVSLNLYVMVNLLREEADLLPLQRKLVSEGKMSRYQRSSSLKIHRKINKVWALYRQGEISCEQILRRLGRAYCPY